MRQGRIASAKAIEVFVSWSGKQAQQAAQAMCSLLEETFASNVRTWFSDTDIAKGTRWNVELAKALDRCAFGVICVTRANRTSPWLLFEAGAIAKTLDGQVFPFLLDLHQAELTGPLAQFQSTLPTRRDVALLIHAINRKLQNPKSKKALDGRYGKAWTRFSGRLRQVRKNDRIKEIDPQVREELRKVLDSLKAFDDYSSLFKPITSTRKRLPKKR